MAEHTHTPREVPGSEQGYGGPVAVPPYTDENPAAHGNIQITERCSVCGAERLVLVNQIHVEYGPWGPTLAERRVTARRHEAAKEARERREEDAALAAHRVQVVETCVGAARVSVDDQPARWIDIADIRAAASQPDLGDGIVPLYRGLLRRVREQGES